MTVTIYHNPRCSKSRKTLELIEAEHLTPDIVPYLNSPPDTSTLKTILTMLGLSPRELMRKQEKPYKELQLDDPTLSEDELIKAMVENPILIERPIVIKDGKAIIGRPPEKVLELL